MRGFAAVFGREIAERRLLVLLGIAGLVPLLLPFVVPSAFGAADLRAIAAYVLAGVVAAVLALGLGGSVLARDAAERRLGFYFARPLSGGAIWGGKLAAALALVLGIGLLVLLPALLFETTARSGLALLGTGRLFLAVGLLAALVLLAHVVSTLVRTRSAWLVLDLVAAVAVGLLAWGTVERLLRARMTTPFLIVEGLQPFVSRALWVAVPLAAAAVLAGSAAQVLAGRTDARRGHRFLSLTLWGLLLAGALGLAGYSRWILAATPADLAGIESVAAAPAGETILVQGPAAHRDGYFPTFLVDGPSGRFSRFSPVYSWDLRQGEPGVGVYFSADGRRALWLEAQSTAADSPFVVVRLDLTRPGARPVPTRLTYARQPRVLALSPDGRRLAILQGRQLTVEDVDSASLLRAATVAQANSWESRLHFLDATHLLFFHRGSVESGWPRQPAPIEVTEIDLATGRQEEIGHTPPLDTSSVAEISPDGSHFLVRPSRESLLLFRTHGTLPGTEIPAFLPASGFLADGRILAVAPLASPEESRQLVLFSPDGAVLRRFAFPGAFSLRPAGEPIPGHLVVGVASDSSGSGSGYHSWEIRLLDLATGESRSLGRGLLPLGALSAGPASSSSRLFQRAGGDGSRVVLLDLASGKERPVTGR
jgi:hypothetical protein